MRFALLVLTALSATAGMGAADVLDGVLEVPVASSQDGYTEDQLAAIAGGTVTEIKKTGAGTLTSKGIASFAGTIRVTDGVLKVSDATGLGTAAGETIVESGATLHFDALSTGYTTYKSERYVIAGGGSTAFAEGTRGAIRITGATCQLSHLTLSADASIYSSTGFHFYDDGDSVLDMGVSGSTLTLQSADAGNLDVELKLDRIVNPGNIEVHDARYFRPGQTEMPGGLTHEVRLYGRTGVINEHESANKTWTIARYGAGGYYSSWGRWDGAIDNRGAGQLSFNINTGKKLAIGKLTGSGAFVKDANLGAIYLEGTNDFASVFEAKGGTLVLGCPESAAGSIVDRFNFSNLTVQLGLTGQTEDWPQGWTSEQIKSTIDAILAAKKANVSVSLHARSGDTFVAKGTFTGDYSGVPIGAVADGTTAYAVSLVDRPKLTVSTTADLVLTADPEATAPQRLGDVKIYKGVLDFKDMGYVDLGTSSIELGANRSADLIGVRFSSGTVFGRSATGGGEIGVPNSIDGRQMFAEVLDGAIVTNRFQFSVGSGSSSGALYQRGGETYMPYTGTYAGFLGSLGDGFVELSGGLMQIEQYLYMGARESGVGQFYVKDGVGKILNSVMYVGDAGKASVYQTGGTFELCKGLTINSTQPGWAGDNGIGLYTVDGAAALTKVSGGAVVVCGRSGGGLGVLNLNNGGTLEAAKVYKSSASETSKSYVNFNGGILKANADCSEMFKDIDAVTVYGGGAIIDTDGHDVTLAAPLAAPAAGGIASIGIDATKFANIVSPPMLTIAGDGFGASAVVNFDSTTRTITGVTVTSPGWGYTAANTTITATYKGWSATTETCAFTLTEEAGAPFVLTKRGEGTLHVATDTLPAGSTVSTEGGCVAVAGAWPSGLKVKLPSAPVEGTKYVLAQAESFPDGVPGLADGDVVPQGWSVKLRGNKAVFSFDRGLMLLFR